MNNQKFKEITSRYFRGQLVDGEYQLLAESLRNKTNYEFFEKLKQDWELQPELDELGYRNLDRLNYQLSRQTSALEKPLILRLWFQTAAVAAILIIGLLFGSTITRLISHDKAFSEQLVFETPRGQKSFVRLPDGSEVWLNAKSRLVYKTFSSDHRQVELKGEAFFTVARNENAPFVVKTNECEVEVLGTTFDIMAYDEFGRKEITLSSGNITVHMNGAEQNLKPGQVLILKDHIYQVDEVNSSDASGWVKNKFNFKNIPLAELMKRLENWYDVDITLENTTGKEVNYTGTFKNEETIWQVLDAIQVYTPITYKKTNLRHIKITVQFKKQAKEV